MDIAKQLLKEHSKQNSLKIRDYIGTDKERFSSLLDLLMGDHYRLSQRSAMVVSACFDANPALFEAQKKKLIHHLLDSQDEIPLSAKRNTIRILQFMEIPGKDEARLFDYCLLQLHSEKETIAVKAFSMKVAYNICKSHPELAGELEEAISLNLDQNPSAGIKNRGHKLLKALRQIQ